MIITEGDLTFTFHPQVKPVKYDELQFYRNQLNNCFGSSKAVDILFISPNSGWLIEIKDYRFHHRTKPTDLSIEIAEKVRDSLAGLVAMHCNSNINEEKKFARDFLKKRKLRIVLHLEQPKTNSKLFPKIADPAKIKQKLRSLLKAVDAHPVVTDIKHTNNNSHKFYWTTT